ncbi:MAG: hypothetical protein PF505_05570 [Vallitaleaceae bacterium]|jgi:hypothetical protein|nr:hypothetical protein [Vallitaleaceae bacterium]
MEEARLVIVTTRKISLSSVMCFVVIYEDKVILAHIDDEERKLIAKEFKETRKEAGIKDVASLTDMVNMLDVYADRYKTKVQVDILEEDERNCVIVHDEVKKVIFTKSHYDYAKANGKRKEGKLVIQTGRAKYTMSHKYLDTDESIRMELRATFVELLK